MSQDAFSPITTEQKLSQPFNGKLYTTVRQVSAEKPLPELGSSMENELGKAFTASLVISCQKGAARAPSDQLVIGHAIIPTEEQQLNTNWQETEVAVGGKQYAAVIRTVILLESAYSSTLPALNTAMPIGSNGRYDGLGYVLYDRECIDSGMVLEPVFRVDRRTFVIKATNVGQQTATWGVEDSAEKIVLPGAVTPFGFGIKAADVSSIGNGHAVESRVNYPAPMEANIIYKLEGEEHDELTGVVINTDKRLVNAAFAKAIAAALRADGFFTEIQPLDKWHSITIGSKLASPPSSQTWVESGNISLPDELDTVGIIWDSNSDKDAGSAGVDNISTIIEKKWEWEVTANASITGEINGRPYILMKNGFRGAAEVTVVRTYSFGPPSGSIVAYAFNPVYGTLTIHNVSKSIAARAMKFGTGDISKGGSGGLKFNKDDRLLIQQIGPAVHGGVILTHTGDPQTLSDTVDASGGSTPGGGLYPAVTASLDITALATLSLPASSPPLAAGSSYIIHVEVKPWRFGYWVKEVYTAKVPS